MINLDFNQLNQFVSYAEQRFDLPLLASCFGDRRAEPGVPSRAVGLSLVLGEVVQIPSLLQLQEETKLGGLPVPDQPRYLWLCQRADGPRTVAPGRGLDQPQAQTRQGL